MTARVRRCLAVLTSTGLVLGVAAALGGPAHGTPAPRAPHRPAHARPAPAAIDGLTVTAVDATTVTVTWTAVRARPGDRVVVRAGDGAQAPVSPAGGSAGVDVTATATSAALTGLRPDTRYGISAFVVGTDHVAGARATVRVHTRTHDAATGVAGQVTDAAGHPLGGVAVVVQNVDGYGGFALTGRNGQYVVTGIPSGSVSVCFRARPTTTGPSPTGYFGSCYHDQPFSYYGGGDPVTVRAGRITRAISGVLPVGGSLSGRVTDASGAAIAGVTVYVFGASSPSGDPVAGTTGADGTYRVRSLQTFATYNVCFDPRHVSAPSPTGYLYTCFGGAPPDGLPAAVSVTAGSDTPGVDQVLQPGAAIAGTVLDDQGRPVAGATVDAFANDGTSGTTDSAGHYRLTGLPTAAYEVCFDGTQVVSGVAPYAYTASCVGDLYDGGPGIDLTAGATTPLDQTLQVAAGIVGTVTGPDGAAVPGVGISVTSGVPSIFSGYQYAVTGADGTYRVTGVTPGTAQICFDATAVTADLISECYDHQPGASGGTPVPVTGGQAVTIDEQLRAGASISGSVTDARGVPLPGASVEIDTADRVSVSYGYTAEDGTWTVRGLEPGSYIVCFSYFGTSDSSPYGYVAQCYDGVGPSGDQATVIPVGPAGATGIDARLADAGAVAGRVTDDQGAAVAGVSMYAYDQSGDYGQAWTNPDGTYEIDGLGAGSSYTVCASAPDLGFVDSCYGGGAAAPVTVTGGARTDGVDVQLTRGGSLAGTVTDTAGTPLTYVEVDIYDAAGNGVGVLTAADGTWSVSGLAPGTYSVCFQPTLDTPGTYVAQCWDGQPSLDTATPVDVTAGSSVGGIDARLVPTA